MLEYTAVVRAAQWLNRPIRYCCVLVECVLTSAAAVLYLVKPRSLLQENEEKWYGRITLLKLEVNKEKKCEFYTRKGKYIVSHSLPIFLNKLIIVVK